MTALLATLVAGCATRPGSPNAATDTNDKLVAYCGAERAYSAGEAGRPYHNICPPELRDEYDTAYTLGRQVFEVNRRLRVIGSTITDKQNRIWRVEREIAVLERAQGRSDLESYELANLKSDVARLQRERAKLTADLDRLRSRRIAESDALTNLQSTISD